MEFRKGDVVSFLGTVKHDADDSKERVFIDVTGSHDTVWLKPEDITLVKARFDVGDRVCWGERLPDGAGGVNVGEIIAISGEHAWIEYGAGEYCTRRFGAIDRLPTKMETEG